MLILLSFSQFFIASPKRSRIFGANIDINLKSCKQFRIFFRKSPKKLSKIRHSAYILTFWRRFTLCLKGFATIGNVVLVLRSYIYNKV